VPSARVRAGPPTDTFVGVGWNVVKHETNNNSTTMNQTSLFRYIYCLQCAGLVSRQRSQVKKPIESCPGVAPFASQAKQEGNAYACGLGASLERGKLELPPRELRVGEMQANRPLTPISEKSEGFRVAFRRSRLKLAAGSKAWSGLRGEQVIVDASQISIIR